MNCMRLRFNLFEGVLLLLLVLAVNSNLLSQKNENQKKKGMELRAGDLQNNDSAPVSRKELLEIIKEKDVKVEDGTNYDDLSNEAEEDDEG